MDPDQQCCHNPDCVLRGQVGRGNIRIQSRKERRYRCAACGRTFAATRDTPFYRLHRAADLLTIVVTLLCHGCPVPAIVAAFGLDERTVMRWQRRAGEHCRQGHEHLVQTGQVELGHVQADELWIKLVGRRVWQAMALAVPSRLWLGGVVSAQRDGALIRRLVERVHACAAPGPLLVCVDGLASYVTAFVRAFRHPVRTGRRGRPRLVPDVGFQLGQVVKQDAKRRVVAVSQRIVRGTLATIVAALAATGGGKVINTAFIERLNATFRACCVPLVRRADARRAAVALAHRDATLVAGMFLVGGAYNFCWPHDSLRLLASASTGPKWRECTPAMAAGLTDHCWRMEELLRYQIPLPAWVTAKRRGRPPKPKSQPAKELAA